VRETEEERKRESERDSSREWDVNNLSLKRTFSRILFFFSPKENLEKKFRKIVVLLNINFNG